MDARVDDEGGERRRSYVPPWVFRGSDLGRLFAFSDGVFAFAATLLVLNLALPIGVDGSAVRTYLLSTRFLGPLYAYAITFLVITTWWQAHHLSFVYIRSYSRTLFRLNALFLVLIAILPFTTDVLTAAGDDWVGPVFFSAVQIATGLALAAVWTYASGRGRLVAPDLPSSWRTFVSEGIFLSPIVFAASIPVAFVSPVLAEVVWVAVFAIPVLRRKNPPS